MQVAKRIRPQHKFTGYRPGTKPQWYRIKPKYFIAGLTAQLFNQRCNQVIVDPPVRGFRHF
jgi:hypothetical protein